MYKASQLSRKQLDQSFNNSFASYFKEYFYYQKNLTKVKLCLNVGRAS